MFAGGAFFRGGGAGRIVLTALRLRHVLVDGCGVLVTFAGALVRVCGSRVGVGGVFPRALDRVTSHAGRCAR